MELFLTKVGPHVDDEGERVADPHGPRHPRAVERVACAHLHRALWRRQREVNRVRGVRPDRQRDNLGRQFFRANLSSFLIDSAMPGQIIANLLTLPISGNCGYFQFCDVF